MVAPHGSMLKVTDTLTSTKTYLPLTQWTASVAVVNTPAIPSGDHASTASKLSSYNSIDGKEVASPITTRTSPGGSIAATIDLAPGGIGFDNYLFGTTIASVTF